MNKLTESTREEVVQALLELQAAYDHGTARRFLHHVLRRHPLTTMMVSLFSFRPPPRQPAPVSLNDRTILCRTTPTKQLSQTGGQRESQTPSCICRNRLARAPCRD
jgi:hypothetical protein